MTEKPPALVLFTGPTSPFARMAQVVGTELGIAFESRTIDVYSAEFLDEFNPLRQIPTLVIDRKTAIFDSRTIFAYFDAISGKSSFLPGDDFAQMSRISLFLGLTEACLHYRMSIILPENERSEANIEKLRVRMNRSLDFLEAHAQETTEGNFRLEQIVAACTLEYIDYRYSNEWRQKCPRLDTWAKAFSQRPSMVESRPSE